MGDYERLRAIKHHLGSERFSPPVGLELSSGFGSTNNMDSRTLLSRSNEQGSLIDTHL